LDESIDDLDLIFASSSRIRKVNKKIIAVSNLKEKIKKGKKIGIIFCFEIFKIFSKKKYIYKTGYKSSVATKSEVNKFLKFIIQGLDKKGFLQPDHKRASMVRNINNIFHRTNLSEQEIRILLGIFSTLNDFNRKS